MLKSHKNNNRILLAYIEPTPYILGLIDELVLNCKDQMDIFFLGENLSQSWNIELDNRWQIFPKKITEKIKFIQKLFRKPRYNLIHVAGWGEPWFVLLII